jgi:3-hydroxyisobutyrate dehydrogenase-like beta-hydroxyacid dehydrogenase
MNWSFLSTSTRNDLSRRKWRHIIAIAIISIHSVTLATVGDAQPTAQQHPLSTSTNPLRIQDYHDITILGLGSMGQAFVQCLLKRNNDDTSNNNNNTTAVKVHAWNRGSEKRDKVRDMGAAVYDTAEAAVQASNITLILIDDWEGIVQLLTKDMNREIWTENKVVVLFSTYSPTDIIQLQNEYFRKDSDTGTDVVLVGGAIVGVPQTVCTPKALILLSADVPQLRTVGRVEVFPGNVGYAALVNMALILVITFGIAGQELAHLIIKQYGVTNMAEFYKAYIPLSAEIGPEYTKMLLPILSHSVVNNEYEKSYVPVGTFRNVLQMHVTFMKEIGIVDDTFLTSYLYYLDKVTNPKYGPAAWIEEVNVVIPNIQVDNQNSIPDNTINDQEL